MHSALSGLARRSLAAALFGLSGTLALSCVSIIGLEDYASAVAQLCDTYNSCFSSAYPGCAEVAGARLVKAADEQRNAWLQMFSANGCTDRCSASRSCLDSKPICGPPTSSCATAAECCGFTSGGGECFEQSCCVPEGRTCSADGECCGIPCLDGTCGGGTCADVGAACVQDEDCCGKLRCQPADRTCSDCLPDGAECSDPAECCSDSCIRGVCDSGCGKVDGELCKTPDECCGGFCEQVPGQGFRVCSTGKCMPDGLSCGDDTDCCDGNCDPFAMVCQPCLPDGAGPCWDGGQCCSDLCNAGQTCGASGCSGPDVPCSSDAECCSGKCDQSGQWGCCEEMPDGCPHPICEEGLPLDPLDCTDTVNASSTCIESICADDAFCCCKWWDNLCVEAVTTLCGQACPNDPN